MFPRLTSGVHHSSFSSSSSSAFSNLISGIHHSSSSSSVFPSCISGVHHSSSPSSGFPSLIFGVHHSSSSSSSSFPGYISGVHHFGWDFCICDRFVFLLFFFLPHPTVEVVTFRLRGWCVLGVFLLLAFTRLGHERQHQKRAMKCMCAKTRPRFILSSERVLGEWSQ